MFTTVLLLSLAYAVLATLLLNIGFLSRLNVWFKFALCLLTGCFIFLHFMAVVGMLGWPTRADLPEKFLLIASETNEPDKENGGAGNIYLWATAIENGSPTGKPRAYVIDYNKSLHEKLNIAKTGQRKGIPQIGEVPERKSVLFSLKTTSNTAEKIEIYDLPDPVLPEK